MLRKNARMSQKELAKGIISVSHLSNLEANRYKASIETIELLAKRLNVLSSYLINYSKENDILRERIISLKEGIILNLGNVNKIINDITLPIENTRSEEHTSELQSRGHLVCRLLLEKKKQHNNRQSRDVSRT